MKNKSHFFQYLLFTFIILASSCSKFEVTEDLGISPSELTPKNINTNLPIIELIVDQAEFDNMIQNFEQDIEIDGKYTMYDSYPSTIIKSQVISLNIKGRSSEGNPLKSLTVLFDNTVDNKTNPIIVVDKLLNGHSVDELKKISLRDSGNDFAETMLKDICYTQLAIDMGLDVELGYYQQVQVFVNKNYYGLLNLRTEKSKKALSKLIGAHKGDINIIRISREGNGPEEIEFKDGDDAYMQPLIDAAKNHDATALKALLDINSFVDYMVYEDFTGNNDWPNNNVQIHSVLDGKFRFFLYDLDFAGNLDKFFAEDDIGSGLLNDMYVTLKNDPDVEPLFIERQHYIYENATLNHFSKILDINATKIEKDINYNISKFTAPKTKVNWYLNLEEIENQFELRRDKYKNHYKL